MLILYFLCLRIVDKYTRFLGEKLGQILCELPYLMIELIFPSIFCTFNALGLVWTTRLTLCCFFNRISEIFNTFRPIKFGIEYLHEMNTLENIGYVQNGQFLNCVMLFLESSITSKSHSNTLKECN